MTVKLELPYELAVLLQAALQDYGAILRQRAESSPKLRFLASNYNQVGQVGWLARYVGHRAMDACNESAEGPVDALVPCDSDESFLSPSDIATAKEA